MSQYTDLIARLRNGYHSLSGRAVVEEAADALEALQAENAQWQEFADITMTSSDDLRTGLAEYRAQKAALAQVEALQAERDAIDAIHQQCTCSICLAITMPPCKTCNQSWPCPTHRILHPGEQ